ncbi:hypothetical protein, partial [Schleiferia thermophila]|uniref:hypothetical protein n=1 Tax=Schleiferia thermophila TaxID=884107 RepID=UPI003EECE01E
METKEKRAFRKYRKNVLFSDDYIEEVALKNKKLGIEEGLERGLKQRLERGKYEKEREAVVNAFKEQVPISVIAKIVGVSEERVLKILWDNGLMQLAFYFSLSAFGLAEQNVMEILGKDLLCFFFQSKNSAARLQGALLESILRQSLREKSYPVQKLLVVHLSPFSEVVRGGMCGSRSCVRDAEGARRAVRSAAEHGS